jgi:hypothetical protein
MRKLSIALVAAITVGAAVPAVPALGFDVGNVVSGPRESAREDVFRHMQARRESKSQKTVTEGYGYHPAINTYRYQPAYGY